MLPFRANEKKNHLHIESESNSNELMKYNKKRETTIIWSINSMNEPLSSILSNGFSEPLNSILSQEGGRAELSELYSSSTVLIRLGQVENIISNARIQMEINTQRNK